MHALPPTSFDCYTAYIGSWWNDFDWKPTKKYYVSYYVIGRIGADQSHRIKTRRILWMKLIIQTFGKELDDKFLHSKMAISHSRWIALACRHVKWWSRLETYHRFKTNFLLLLKWQNFWQLNVSKFHSFVISDLGNGKWQVAMGKV